MSMLLTTSDGTPTLLGLQAGNGDLLCLDELVFERMIQDSHVGATPLSMKTVIFRRVANTASGKNIRSLAFQSSVVSMASPSSILGQHTLQDGVP